MYGNSPYNAIVLQLSCKTFFPPGFPTRMVALVGIGKTMRGVIVVVFVAWSGSLTRAVLATPKTLDDNFPPIEYSSGRGQPPQPN
jgi:hypothetical protein